MREINPGIYEGSGRLPYEAASSRKARSKKRERRRKKNMKKDQFIESMTSDLEIKLGNEPDIEKARRRNKLIKEKILEVKQYYQEKFMQKLEKLQRKEE